MNPQFNDHQLALISGYYPVGTMSQQHVPEQGALVKRKRKLSEEQLSMLERSFGEDQKLEVERKEQLAAKLDLDPRQVAVWFQNRRARLKTKNLEKEYYELQSQHKSTVYEKGLLETEIQKMKEQLKETEKVIERLSERGEQLRSNNPSSSVSSMVTNNIEPQSYGEYEWKGTDFEWEFDTNNIEPQSYGEFEWDGTDSEWEIIKSICNE